MKSRNRLLTLTFYREQYFNDTQEIDLEFLSRQFNSTSSPVNLVIQSAASARAGFDASKTADFNVHQLPFRPDQGFHEYRFDWSPGKVSFYADGKWLIDMTTNIPVEGSKIHFVHWSDGRKGWSEGPPAEDSLMTISYFKAYFNSTDTQRQRDYRTRCVDPSAPKAVCQVPDQTVAPDPALSKGYNGTYFFSEQLNMTNNQTEFGAQSGSTRGWSPLSFAIAVPILAAYAFVL